MQPLKRLGYTLITHSGPLRSAYFGSFAGRMVSTAFAHADVSPIIIYQMGKVGSTTVYSTLKSSDFARSVLHVHTLAENIQVEIDKLGTLGVVPAPFHFYVGKALRQRLLRSPERRLKLISLVRDPIAREVSGLFQTPYYAERRLTSGRGTLDPDQVRTYLNATLAKPDAFRYCNEWFDREIRSFFNIDVFSERFPYDKGYCLLSRHNIEILVIQLERLGDVGPLALSEFLGTGHPLELRKDNERSASSGGSEYKDLLKDFSLDESVCRSIYSSRFARHFYSPETIERFVAHWSSPRS